MRLVRVLATAFFISLLPAFPVAAQAPAPAPTVTVLKAARMFDGRSDATVANAVVIVEGSKIRDAGSGLPVPPGATVVDLGDATLLPGFIDSHMHLTFEAGENYVTDFFEGLRRTVPEKALMAGGNARRLLEAGFTTVRNVGAYDDVDVGTLEKGKEADIVAVFGDPLADIHTTEKVFFVMKGGRIWRQPSQ
jgi:imidazolonepropionase-like amidohydrolase